MVENRESFAQKLHKLCTSHEIVFQCSIQTLKNLERFFEEKPWGDFRFPLSGKFYLIYLFEQGSFDDVTLRQGELLEGPLARLRYHQKIFVFFIFFTFWFFRWHHRLICHFPVLCVIFFTLVRFILSTRKSLLLLQNATCFAHFFMIHFFKRTFDTWLWFSFSTLKFFYRFFFFLSRLLTAQRLATKWRKLYRSLFLYHFSSM